MWNESATSARECTVYPAISSTKKKAVSIPSRIIIRVDLESPMVAVLEREALRCVRGGVEGFIETDRGFRSSYVTAMFVKGRCGTAKIEAKGHGSRVA
jgi:hypothetical protein